MYHKMHITAPPPPPELRTFDCLPVWVINATDAFAEAYTHLLQKLRGDAEAPPFTLLALPDINWLKSHIEPRDRALLHDTIAGRLYGVLCGSQLIFSGSVLTKMPMSPGNRVWDGGYAYLAYDTDVEMPSSIFGMYGQRFCGLHTRGAWLPRCTNVTQSLLDQPLADVALIGRVTVVTNARELSNHAALFDLRLTDSASTFEMCPEHPIAK